MGMSKINIWVSGMDDPCSIDNRTWYVTLYDCDGNVFQWCKKKYLLIPAPCAHVEVEVPPGCYYIKAVWGFSVIVPGFKYRVNHFTDAAIVQVCCHQSVCVKLFNPSAHRCGTIIVRAVRDLLKQKAIKAETARKVNEAIDELLKQLPEPAKKFELGHLKEIDESVQKLEGKRKGK